MSKPKIRFKGYEEDWEQRKLSDLLYLSNEKNDGRYTKDDVLAASLGTELQKKQFYFGLKATDKSVKNYKVVKPTDVIYTKSPIKGFPNGIIRTSKGESGIVPTLYCVYHSVDEIDSSIIQSYFEDKERLDAYLMPLVNIGARNNVNITDKGFLEGTICIPKDKQEQVSIINVLASISELITLHQRKCEETKKLKKYMLQKMFPQNGKRVPEIRFAGFTDDWEQRKLSDVVDSVDTGKSKFDKEGSSGEYPILGSTSVIGYDDEYDYEGDFILTARVGANAGSLYRHAGKVKISDNTVFIQASQNIEFLYQLLIRFDIKRLSFGTGQPLVKASELKRLELMMPTDMEEQMRIGVYFKNLDHLITLHQRKYEELQKIKKFMLQNMFI